MAIAVVNKKETGSAATGSLAITAATKGNRLCAFIHQSATAAQPTLAGWTFSATKAETTSAVTFVWFAQKVAEGGETEVKPTPAEGGTIQGIAYYELSGASETVDAIVKVDKNASAKTVASPGITTTATGDIVLMGVGGGAGSGTIEAWSASNAATPIAVETVTSRMWGASYIPGGTLAAVTFTSKWTTEKVVGMLVVALQAAGQATANAKLNVGTSLSVEAFSGGVPVYYGPGGEETAEKAVWEAQEKEPTNTATTGVRYLRAWRAETKRRTVIFIHGGGDVNNQWRTLEGFGQGSGQYVQSFSPKGAEHSGKPGHGFCVFNLNYRDRPAVTPERQLQDVIEGIRFCIANAEAYNGDPGKIYLLGGSAGVGLALRAAQIINNETPGAVAGVCGFSPYGFDFELIAKEMETGAYREWPRLVGAFKEKSTSILELAAHGLISGAQIEFTSLPNETSGLKTATRYYVKRVSASEIELSITEGGGAIVWTAFGAGTLTMYERHPGGSIPNLVENLQIALNQELNYTGSGFTPTWAPTILTAPEKTNTGTSRTLQKYLSPRGHSTPGQLRVCFITCEKDLIEQGWINPTVAQLAAEGHSTTNYVVTEGAGQEGHSFGTLWGVNKVNPGKPLEIANDVLAAWIEENVYTVPLNVGTKLSPSISRTFPATLKTGVQVASAASRTIRAAQVQAGPRMSATVSRTFNASLRSGITVSATVSRSRAVSLSTGVSIAAPVSRTFPATLSVGTRLAPRVGNNFRPVLSVGTKVAGTASRTFSASLWSGTRLDSGASRCRAVSFSTGAALTAGASRTAAVQLRTGTTLSAAPSRSRAVSLSTGASLAASTSRTFSVRLQSGMRLTSTATTKACRPTMPVGTMITVTYRVYGRPAFAYGQGYTSVLAYAKSTHI